MHLLVRIPARDVHRLGLLCLGEREPVHRALVAPARPVVGDDGEQVGSGRAGAEHALQVGAALGAQAPAPHPVGDVPDAVWPGLWERDHPLDEAQPAADETLKAVLAGLTLGDEAIGSS